MKRSKPSTDPVLERIETSKRKSIALFLLALMLTLLLPILNLRGAMVELSLEQLVHDADLVIIGTVEYVRSEFSDGKSISFATLSVNSVIKGDSVAPRDKIVVRFPGGIVGSIGMKVENSPNYKHGEDILVFLKTVPNQTYYKTSGSSQGKFLIKDNIVVRENLSLDQLIKRIESIIHSTSSEMTNSSAF